MTMTHLPVLNTASAEPLAFAPQIYERFETYTVAPPNVTECHV